MKKYDYFSNSIANLAFISIVYSFLINANNAILFIQDVIDDGQFSFSFQRLMFGLISVFIMSWITLVVNLHVIPQLIVLGNKYALLKAVILNFILYSGFLVILFSLAVRIGVVENSNLIPQAFGWGVVFMISILIYSAIKYQGDIRHEQMEKEALKIEKIKSELNEIKSIINPHFLFNSLNTLNALIKIDAVKASKFTTHLSRLYRYILSSRNKDLISIKEELFFINDYVQLLKIRYNDCFDIKVDIKAEDQVYLIPPLSLQLLIENAEKHNVFNESNPLQIDIFTENEFLVVTHPLMQRALHSNSMGNGLSSLSKRCRILFKRDIHIIKNKNFTVKMPLSTRFNSSVIEL